MGFNAMEVVNSGATQTDALQLFRDWMALLNRGYSVTPVGSSDAHDVGRHFVGQGRTYIRCDDRDPANIDVEQAVASFVKGSVMVSYGLLVEIRVNDRYQSGDLAQVAGDDVVVDRRVLGPHWVSASKVMLFENGQLVREQTIEDGDRDSRTRGVLWSNRWKLPTPRHDVHLVAIAVGTGPIRWGSRGTSRLPAPGIRPLVARRINPRTSSQRLASPSGWVCSVFVCVAGKPTRSDNTLRPHRARLCESPATTVVLTHQGLVDSAGDVPAAGVRRSMLLTPQSHRKSVCLEDPESSCFPIRSCFICRSLKNIEILPGFV